LRIKPAPSFSLEHREQPESNAGVDRYDVLILSVWSSLSARDLATAELHLTGPKQGSGDVCLLSKFCHALRGANRRF
jgi:hypothetical protein